MILIQKLVADYHHYKHNYNVAMVIIMFSLIKFVIVRDRKRTFFFRKIVYRTLTLNTLVTFSG